MNKASAPDPWGSNRHAVRPQAESSSSTNHRRAPDASQGIGGAWDTQRAQASPARTWAAGSSSGAKRNLVGPPYVYLWISFAAATLSLILAMVSSGLILFGIAWAIAGFVGFGAAVIFVQRDALRQAEVFYLRDPRAPWVYRAAIVLSLIAVVVTAVRVALVVGRMG